MFSFRKYMDLDIFCIALFLVVAFGEELGITAEHKKYIALAGGGILAFETLREFGLFNFIDKK
jgi:hypothetical protein